MTAGWLDLPSPDHHSRRCPKGNRRHHAEAARRKCQQGNGTDRDRRVLTVGTEISGHTPDGLRHNGNGHDFEAVQGTGTNRPADRRRHQRKNQKNDRRG